MATITERELVEGLRTKPAWAARAMVVLFERQTRDEQAASDSRHLNQRGFSAFDARTGSKLARFVLAARGKGRPLSQALYGKALDQAIRLAVKYRRQLLEEASIKEEA